MTARRIIHGGTAAIAALGLAAAAAYADGTIYAAPPNQFVGGDITIAQGEKVTFTNGDTVPHDVTAGTKGADGNPLFASEKVGAGQSAAVAGVEYLTTGSYGYICSIHPGMKGTITVSSAGTPAPRPGSGGSGSPPPSPASTDTVAPATTVKVLDTKRAAVRKRRSLQLEVKTNEPATLAITARSGKTTVATGSARVGKAGTRKLTVKLTKAGLKLVKSSRNVRIAVAVEAKDAAGNASAASASGRLR
jgi:plastocyanin